MPYSKKEIKSVDSLKTTCILKKRKMLLPSLRERPAFLNSDIFYCTLQRVCLIFLTFHKFHLLRQIHVGPLYPSKGVSVSTGLITTWKNTYQ